jgi:hypothetical protein
VAAIMLPFFLPALLAALELTLWFTAAAACIRVLF